MLTKRITIATISLVLLGIAANRPAAAQNQPQGAIDSRTDADQPRDFVPGKKSADAASRSFVDRFLRRARNSVGFSVGIAESYVPRFDAAGRTDSTTVTTLSPRLFFGTGGRRSQFMFDYAFDYRRYNQNGAGANSSHRGTVTYHYQMSANVDLTIANELRSIINDQGLSSGSSLTQLAVSNFNQLLYVPQGRSTTNQLRSQINYQLGRRTNLNVFGTYHLWRYHDVNLPVTHTVDTGVNTSYRVNRWLFLDNTFSHTLTGLSYAGNTNIQRLQIGNIRFQSRRGLELALGGGMESASYQKTRDMTGSLSAALSKTTASTTASIRYHHGFSVAVGPGTLLAGDNVSLSVSQWLGRRTNLQLSSTYLKGSAASAARLDSIYTDGGLEIALGSHLLLTTHYWHVSQRSATLSTVVPNASHQGGSIGLEFFTSSLLER
jgi:hypothetical protein